jgi:deoxyribose-phosphate aldolase
VLACQIAKKAGATRLGTSGGIAIVTGTVGKSSY